MLSTLKEIEDHAMNNRTFGRTGWKTSEIGYGMWGMADWTGSEDAESLQALNLSVELGCNFFDTAYAYGDGHSEQLLGQLLSQHRNRRLYTASKIPPKNRVWPSQRDFRLDDVFPPDYIRQMTEKTLENLGVDTLDLQQFHVWEDDWADDDRWQRAVDDLKRQGMIRAVGISVNRWEPWNALRTVRTGMIDSVQVIYNIFDQSPEDELFPLCREHNVAVIARVPFDEGTLTGTLTRDSKWPPRRLAQQLLRSREPRCQCRASRPLEAISPARYDDAGVGPAMDSGQRHGQHDHPWHASLVARGSEPRRERWPKPLSDPAGRTEASPLGSSSHHVVAIAWQVDQ